MKSLGIIGAGASGLCAIKHALSYGIEIIMAFEQTSEIGGTWVYRDEFGKDKYGLDIHSSMYQGLHTNLPKEVMHFPDYPFPESTHSYLSASAVLKYYQSYAEDFDLNKFIKFEHHVLRVRPLKTNKTTDEEVWEVIVKDLKYDMISTYHFDAILVCNGHYNAPHIPDYENRVIFKGRQVHSHDYRCPKPFSNKSVLIIGAGPSARDALLDIQHVAKHVTWSHHLKKLPCTKFNDNVIQKPDIRKLTSDGAIFIDESYQAFDVILYCTGYRYTFPFLSVDCRITVNGSGCVEELYKHCLNINKPMMGIIGLPNFVCPNQMFDLQVRFCLTFMTGRKALPSRDEMIDDLNNDKKIQFVERELPKKKFHLMGVGYHDKYYQALADVAEIEGVKPVIIKIFEKGLCLALFNYDGFRNERFKVLDDENFIIEKIE